MDKLRDIKDIVDVPDNSLYILIMIVLTSILIVGLVLYFYKNKRVKKRLTPKEIALNKLKDIDYSNTKDAVYTFSIEGSRFTNEYNIERFNKIEDELKRYKYRKDVPTLNSNLIQQMRDFIKDLK